MNWFHRLTGFSESDYRSDRSRLRVEGRHLVSDAHGRRWGIGEFEMPSLAELRQRAASAVDGSASPAGGLSVSAVSGDVRALHAQPEYAGALFQVASQFNMLEMVHPDFTPEDGVAGYEHDRTQGPACAIAAGAATVYRNYFVPVGDQAGQSRARQLDGLADLGEGLAGALGASVPDLWEMRNGYALCTPEGLDRIGRHLAAADEAARDALRARLRIGLHWEVEVTDAPGTGRPVVSQAFCSALPVAYSGIPGARWQGFARLVLEAAYEATLLAGLLNARRTGSRVVALTRLGGGAFGNEGAWIDDAMDRAFGRMASQDLEVRVVVWGEVPQALRRLERAYPVSARG
jgi:hypothetical protein